MASHTASAVVDVEGAVDAYTARAGARRTRGEARDAHVQDLARRRRRRASSSSTSTDVVEGMVVLDAVHQIQAEQANDLAVRWNCKAGKCGSCSAEINGKPQADVHDAARRAADATKPVTVEPMRAFPHDARPRHRRVVELRGQEEDQAVQAAQARRARRHVAHGSRRDIDRVQEFRKCIECFLCQDVCHVLRDHHKHEEFIGPRFLVYAAALEMHPLDTADRVPELKEGARASATATSRSAARRCVPSTSRSRTTRSSRSRSAWSTSSSIRSGSS